MGQMSYEGEEMIKCTLSYHYDFWEKDSEKSNTEVSIVNASNSIVSV